MTAARIQTFTLEEFLSLPRVEDSPAWELIDGIAVQKPMPKTRHSLLQKRLLGVIDNEVYTALPELRCTFGGRSIVSDVAVVAWDRIPINADGEPEDNFNQAPDWTIEILSPDQNTTRVIDNILHCLRHGTKLGWMIDPDDYSILNFAPELEVYRGDRILPVIDGIDLTLTAQQIFAWLKISNR